jgi:8-oxo-dGTP diphosphatase
MNQRGEILISRRHQDTHQGGLWEFPGGKVEAGETVEDALLRELHEELGIQVQSFRALLEVQHDYGDKQVLLDVWLIDHFSGAASGREGQPLRWCAPSCLREFEFPAANRAIVDACIALED